MDKCCLICNNKLKDDRKLLLKLYWDLGDHTRQCDYIARNINVFIKKKNNVMNLACSNLNFV